MFPAKAVSNSYLRDNGRVLKRDLVKVLKYNNKSQ
jgi:hypothetical protein